MSTLSIYKGDKQCERCGEESAEPIFDPAVGLEFCSARCHELWLDGCEQFGNFLFKLTNEQPRKHPQPIDNNDRSRQSVLFTGLDCLPGQQELFDNP